MNKLGPKDIKPFEWEELNGKTLRIVAGRQEGALIVVGYDQETEDVYVMHEEISKAPRTLPTIKPGDKVRHKEKKGLGEGFVSECYKDGSGIRCFFPHAKHMSKVQFFTEDEIGDLEVSHD